MDGPQLSGSLSGNNVNVVMGKGYGDAKSNVSGGVFASGPLHGNAAPTTGAFLNATNNGHGVGVEYSKVPGFGTTLQQSAQINLMQQNNHSLDAKAFHSRTHLENGFKFDQVGGALNYNHANGHGASLGASRIPQINTNSVGINGNLNLMQSQNRMTSLDLNGGVSRSFGPQASSSWNKNIGLNVTRRF